MAFNCSWKSCTSLSDVLVFFALAAVALAIMVSRGIFRDGANAGSRERLQEENNLHRLCRRNPLIYQQLLLHLVGEQLARPRYARLESADRAVAQARRFLVGEAAGADQDQCLAGLRAELPQRRREFLQLQR